MRIYVSEEEFHSVNVIRHRKSELGMVTELDVADATAERWLRIEADFWEMQHEMDRLLGEVQ